MCTSEVDAITAAWKVGRAFLRKSPKRAPGSYYGETAYRYIYKTAGNNYARDLLCYFRRLPL